MRTIFAGMIAVAGLALFSVPTATAAPLGGETRAGSRAGMIEQVQYGRSRYCERLRRACTFKEERGEQGEGNCRRYRRECGND
jgi:hypothetical protein